ncbi:MAG: CCA tRNA nucleotidyltransferase [Verrucomicrobiaceae bacterium]|nr:CCA tRNA nucleotidyltransferase [Verrucomicrobiaceae bacterium]
MAVSAQHAAREVAVRLRNAGYQALFAGGCVRDTLISRNPKDYDVATDATPEDVIQLFPGALTVGAHFGVVIVKRDGHQIEVATFRKDGEYVDGRHPESVTFSSPEEDAKRRDFTVNGLFADPESGEVIDYVGGQDDLEKRVIRAIGDPNARFAEDQLRLMRAIRFSTVLGFEIEPVTWAALKALAPSIARVSEERVRDELCKILVHPNRVRGFDLLVESDLMSVILPEILDLAGCTQPPQFHPEGDVFVHTRLMLSFLKDQSSLPLVLSVLLHDIAKPATRSVDPDGRIRFNGHDRLGATMAEGILRRLKFPNDVIEPVVEAVANHMIFKDVQRMRVAKLKRFMARDGFDDELELHRVDCLGCHGLLDNHEFLQAKQVEFASAPLIPERLITGADLIELGWTPSPALGAKLTDVQTLQLEGKISTREEALAWVQSGASLAE